MSKYLRVLVGVIVVIVLVSSLSGCGVNSRMWGANGGAAAEREEMDQSSMTIDDYCSKYPSNCDTSAAD